MTKDFANYKNSKNFKRQAGQILIIFLLVLVVGLALVLSVASRSITDIRITTSTDESNRAYFAAEAGVEEALKQLQKGPYTGGELDFTAVNKTKAKVKVQALSPGTGDAFLFPEKYKRDSVVQVSLLNNFNSLNLLSPVNNTGNLIVYWGVDGLPLEDTPAIEVSVVHTNGSGGWGIKKFAFDPNTASHGNNFCSALGSTSVILQGGGVATPFAASAVIEFMKGYSPIGCSGGPVLEGVNVAAGHYPVLARIRLLYNNQPQPVAVGTGGTFVLPVQGTEVVSTGSTVSGVTRKLKVTRLFPALPSIFDYVLFSGGDLVK